MNNIQEAINICKDESLKAHIGFLKAKENNNDVMKYVWAEFYRAFNELIPKLTLLLNEETQTTVKKPEA